MEWEETEVAAVEDAVWVASSGSCEKMAAEAAETLSSATLVVLAGTEADAAAMGLAAVSADGMAGLESSMVGRLKSVFDGVPSMDVLEVLDGGERLGDRVA